MKKLILLALCFTFINKSNAQFTKYIVKFKNKVGTPHTLSNPNTYLSANSIARRTKYNIAIDSTDLPITPRYIDSIKSVANVTVLNSNKWLNQVAIVTTSTAALTKINSFPFVENTTGIAARLLDNQVSIGVEKLKITPALPFNIFNITERVQLDYGQSLNQINIHNGQFLHNRNFLGNNMRIALMDAGFATHVTNVGVDSLRINNQIIETWDFVSNNANVNDDDAHGFYCLSILGSNKPNQHIGTAPKANYYLYRTEDVGSEFPIEEQNWVVAAERADSIGVDVFSTSLGYIDFDNSALDYTYAQRNGDYAIMTKGADLAAKKGILVFNSAGNNGAAGTDYKYVAIPADADSIVAVGSCSNAGLIATSSAWGPAFGGAIKPNVTSLGVSAAYFNTAGFVSSGSGTSFACPNIAGLGTALWQAFPEINNMAIIDAMQQAGHIATAPDGRFGYGIPNMKKAFVIGLQKTYQLTQTFNNCVVLVNFKSKDDGVGTYTLERKLTTATNFTTLKTINMLANSWQLKNYEFRDTMSSVAIGNYTYRIKYTLSTDSVFYYPEFNFNHTAACVTPIAPINIYNIKIAPNPIQNQLTINLGSVITPKHQIKVYDYLGKIVYNQSYTNNRIININAVNWSSGMYYVEVWSNDKKLFLKQIVKE